MTQHIHQLVRDIPTPKATSEYYWKRVQVTGFMCYCKKCNHRVDKAGIIPENCPNCGGGLEIPTEDTEISKDRWRCPFCNILCGSELLLEQHIYNKHTPTPSNNLKGEIILSPEEPKTEYKIKCKYCGDIQILNKASFEKILENGCGDECWECMERGYEPVIPGEPFVLSYENLEKVARNHPHLELVDGEPEKDCWLCEGTGFVMKDRQTGAMHGKEPSIDWTTKDHWEYPCPICNDVTEGVPCDICGGSGVLGDCIGICEPPNKATHTDQMGVPQCDECHPEWKDGQHGGELDG